MENYAVCILRLQPQHLIQMPGYGLSLKVFIGSQPYRVRLGGGGLQFRDQVLLLCRYLVHRLEIIVYVDTEVLLAQVTYMAET